MLDVLPGIGIGPIRLGMRPAEVLAVFPETRDGDNWLEGNLNDAYLYRDLRLHFDRCDSHGPIPDSQLVWIVIRPRPDVRLFGRLLGEWEKNEFGVQLFDCGYRPEFLSNGDVVVRFPYLGASFDDAGRLVWLEME